MSDPSAAAGAGFSVSTPQTASIGPNTTSDAPAGFGGRFFDDIDVSSPATSDSQSLSDMSSEGEDSGEALSQAAEEVSDEVLEATEEGAGKAKPKDKVKAKTYKVSVNGKNVELPLDAKFSVPVDGKSTQVSINDLVSNYNGKVSYDKRFTELDKDRQSFRQEKGAHDSDKQALNDGLGHFFKLIQQKKGPQAWAHMIKMAGLDGQYSLQDLRKEVYEQQRHIESMSPEQRQAMESQEQAEFYRSEFEQLTGRQEAQKAQAQAEAALDQVLSSHAITRDMFGQYHSQLTQGGVHPQEVTPDLIIDYHSRLGAYKAIRQAAEKTDPSILKNEKLVAQLKDFKLANPEMTTEDIADVIKSWKGDTRARKISEKVRQAKTPISASVRAPAPARKPNGQFDREDFMF